MKRSYFILILFLSLFVSRLGWSELHVVPTTQQDFTDILKGLANDHAYRQWCTGHCGQIYVLKLSGTISSGVLDIDITGNIVGKNSGVLPLFGAVPAVDVLSLKNAGQDVPLLFYRKSYYTLLEPGAFHLTGQIKIDSKAATNFTLPGAVGQVLLNIQDQEPLLKNVSLGQIGASFQIISQAKSKAAQTEAPKHDLRLMITRVFHIARDKTFSYNIKAVGAEAGQVISLLLENNEKVLETQPQNAKISADKIDFTATGAENNFVVEGEWTDPDLKLTAPAGTVTETWSVSCEGAYDCQFAGDVEKSVASDRHQWEPMPGQTLSVKWQELAMLKGQSIVVQQVLLDSFYHGKGLKQKLQMEVSSSAVNQLYLALPKDSIPTALSYDGNISPILKNDKGLVHLTIPQGLSAIGLEWDLPAVQGFKIPSPSLDLPVSKWVFWAHPDEDRTALFAAGLPGSPVVLFWPRMVFCLFLGVLFLLGEKKYSGKIQTKTALFLLFTTGFALLDPWVMAVVIAFLVVIRLLLRAKEPRNIFGYLFESGIILGLFAALLVSFFEIMNQAFFSNSPFAFKDFCQAEVIFGHYKDYSAFCWQSDLLSSGSNGPVPFFWTVPVFGVRVVFFFWALAAGYFLFTELKNLLAGLKHYYGRGLKPVVRKVAKIK